jgi:hypothetical protein
MLLAHLCTFSHNGELKVFPPYRLRFDTHSEGAQVIALSIKRVFVRYSTLQYYDVLEAVDALNQNTNSAFD